MHEKNKWGHGMDPCHDPLHLFFSSWCGDYAFWHGFMPLSSLLSFRESSYVGGGRVVFFSLIVFFHRSRSDDATIYVNREKHGYVVNIGKTIKQTPKYITEVLIIITLS